jgi:hypothetical protein
MEARDSVLGIGGWGVGSGEWGVGSGDPVVALDGADLALFHVEHGVAMADRCFT